MPPDVMIRPLRRAVALIALSAVVFAQTLAAAHPLTPRGEAIAAAGLHACCPDSAGPAPISNGCEVHCSDASKAPAKSVDVPSVGWVPVMLPKAAVASATHALDRPSAKAVAPRAPPPLATSGRLLI